MFYRQVGPRFAEGNSFEHEYGEKWKQLYEMKKQVMEWNFGDLFILVYFLILPSANRRMIALFVLVMLPILSIKMPCHEYDSPYFID